ncbi:MAG: pantoate--beta-alanine ligase [Acidobacteria bacterium]|nr:pantoate--beta-alanine ligase [Acidobacteriota bacterium]
MIVIESKAAIPQIVSALRRSEGKTGFISIMGLLHEGHLALVRKTKEMADTVLAMVFANPMLVTDPEVLAAFDAARDSDREILEAEGVDYAFFAGREDIFPPAHRTYATCRRLLQQFEGIESANYIRGLGTSLIQMLNLFRPSFFIIGQKNYLDYLLLKRIVRDYSFSTEVVLTPCVRDESGMAYSSFNRFYTPEERQAAMAISDALLRCRETLLGGETSVKSILRSLQETLSKPAGLTVMFAGVLDPQTADRLDKIHHEALVMVTAKVGRFRVTDNILFKRKSD